MRSLRFPIDLGLGRPGDELFEALAPEMINTGVLLREINERIEQVGRDRGTRRAAHLWSYLPHRKTTT